MLSKWRVNVSRVRTLTRGADFELAPRLQRKDYKIGYRPAN